MLNRIANCLHCFGKCYICPDCGLTKPEAEHLVHLPVSVIESLQHRIDAEQHLSERLAAIIVSHPSDYLDLAIKTREDPGDL